MAQSVITSTCVKITPGKVNKSQCDVQFSARASGACEIALVENILQFVNGIFTQGGIYG